MNASKGTIAVELTREELAWIHQQASTQAAEFSRVLANLEEEEGESAPKWNLLRTVRPQAELLSDLVSKLDGAAKEAGWRK